MKPLAGYVGYNSEWRELAQVITRVCLFFAPLKFSSIILTI
jgi:hypothetical protein